MSTNQQQQQQTDLIVKQSLIQGAGMGLFANKKYLPGDRIVEYTGEFKTYDPQNPETEKHHLYEHAYCFEYKKGHCIDAGDPSKSSLARYANDAYRSTFKHNAKYSLSWKGCNQPCVWVKATKTINPGDEIFVSYGPVYWKQSGSNNTNAYDTRVTYSNNN